MLCLYKREGQCILRGTRRVFMFQNNFVLMRLKCTLISLYLLTSVGLAHDASSTVHIYTQTIHRTTQLTTEQHN